MLKDVYHDVIHVGDCKISQYGIVDNDDEIKDVFKKMLIMILLLLVRLFIGILKTFIDRLYMLPEVNLLKGKKLYLFVQGSAPDDATKNSISFLANKVATLMGMDLIDVVLDTSDGNKILNSINFLNMELINIVLYFRFFLKIIN